MIFSFLSAITNSFAMIFLHDLKGKVTSLISLQYFYIGQCLINNLFVMGQDINFS